MNFLALSILFDNPQKAYDIFLKLRRICLQSVRKEKHEYCSFY